MAEQDEQVNALKQAILTRAQNLADEHIRQGNMTRQKIMQDVREKIQLMEQKELLSAKEKADRAYSRQIQAADIRMQSELDRNRWGLVQSVMSRLVNCLAEIRSDEAQYRPVFISLLQQASDVIGKKHLVAHVNDKDLQQFSDNWASITTDIKNPVKIRLSENACICTGGVMVLSADGNLKIDNTFEGIISRIEMDIEQAIFEKMFSKVSSMEPVFHG